MPPFPIIGTIQMDIVELCIKSAMALDFKIKQVPFKILRNMKNFLVFPSVFIHFGGNAKKTLSLTGQVAAKPPPDVSAAEETVDASDLGDNFAKGQSRAADAKDAVSKADAQVGKMKLSKEDKEEEDAGGADGDDDNDDAPAGAYDLSDEALESKFMELDVDMDGFITPAELEKAIREMGASLKENEIKRMMKEADSDGDGRIDTAEFKAAMRFDSEMEA